MRTVLARVLFGTVFWVVPCGLVTASVDAGGCAKWATKVWVNPHCQSQVDLIQDAYGVFIEQGGDEWALKVWVTRAVEAYGKERTMMALGRAEQLRSAYLKAMNYIEDDLEAFEGDLEALEDMRTQCFEEYGLTGCFALAQELDGEGQLAEAEDLFGRLYEWMRNESFKERYSDSE